MNTRVFIGNLPYDVTERDVGYLFRGYGQIRHVLLRNTYAFVDFEHHEDADAAVYELDGTKMGRNRVIVEQARERGRPRYRHQYRSRSRTPEPQNRTLIVQNVSSTVSWQDLKDFMNRIGGAIYADVHRPYLHEGTVEFTTQRHAKEAKRKLNKTVLNGRQIRIRRHYDRSSSRSASPPTPELSVCHRRSWSRGTMDKVRCRSNSSSSGSRDSRSSSRSSRSSSWSSRSSSWSSRSISWDRRGRSRWRKRRPHTSRSRSRSSGSRSRSSSSRSRSSRSRSRSSRSRSHGVGSRSQVVGRRPHDSRSRSPIVRRSHSGRRSHGVTNSETSTCSRRWPWRSRHSNVRDGSVSSLSSSTSGCLSALDDIDKSRMPELS